MCFAPGNDFDVRFIKSFRLTKGAVPFAHFLPLSEGYEAFCGRKTPKMQREDSLRQTCHEMRTLPAVCHGSRPFTFDTISPNQFIKGM